MKAILRASMKTRRCRSFAVYENLPRVEIETSGEIDHLLDPDKSKPKSIDTELESFIEVRQFPDVVYDVPKSLCKLRSVEPDVSYILDLGYNVRVNCDEEYLNALVKAIENKVRYNEKPEGNVEVLKRMIKELHPDEMKGE